MPICAIAGFSKGEGGSMTSGVVGEMQLQALPSVPPVVTVILTAIAVMVGTYIISRSVSLLLFNSLLW